MKLLRLSHESDEDKRIARHCDFFLDGAPVPPETLFEADEEMGYVEEGYRLKDPDHPPHVWRWELVPGVRPQQPKLSRTEGKVEIYLKPDAPEEVRRLYEARRQE